MAVSSADDPDFVRLMLTIREGDQKQLEALLNARPELVHGRDADGETPLHLAAEHNDPVMGVTLLAFGADPQAPSRYSSPGFWLLTPGY